MRRTVVAAVDAVLVVVFATLGRIAHSEGLSVGDVARTAWPFLAGLGLGWVLLLATRSDPRSARSGLLVWLATLGGGMTLWGVQEGKVPHWSFVVFAGVVTALLLQGWRAVARLVSERAVRTS